MKKIVCSILLLGIINTSFGQNRINNHMLYGTTDVNFNVSPPAVTANTVPTGDYTTYNSVQAVSDNNGNILFYTNGVEVYDKNKNEISGTGSFTSVTKQPFVVVPHPGNDKKYFVITAYVAYYLCGGSCGTNYRSSYQYAIVDFSDPLKPLGKVIAPYYLGRGRSDASDPENIGTFCPLTVVKNATNTGYYVVTHRTDYFDEVPDTNISYPIDENKSFLESYAITTSGLNPYPTTTQVSHKITTVMKGIMKFSPDGTKMVELTDDGTGKLLSYNFNNATGAFSNPTTVQSFSDVANFKNFEFSADSKKLFYIKNNLFVKDLDNLSTAARSIAETNATTIPTGFKDIQRNVLGEIYVTNANSFCRIENQNSFTNASVKLNHLAFSTTPNEALFPQLIPIFIPACFTDVTITENLTIGTSQSQASNNITVSNTIESGVTAIYHGGNSVVLSNNFLAKSGAIFRAYIEGCSGNYAARSSNDDVEAFFSEDEFASPGNVKAVTIYPNPSDRAVTVASIGKIKNISLTSFDGKVVFSKTINGETNYEIDLSTFATGIYFITVEDANGKITTEKVVKK